MEPYRGLSKIQNIRLRCKLCLIMTTTHVEVRHVACLRLIKRWVWDFLHNFSFPPSLAGQGVDPYVSVWMF